MKPLLTASNGISMNPRAGGSGRADSPAIRARTRFTRTPLTLACLLLSLHSFRVKCRQDERRGKKAAGKGEVTPT